MQNKAWENEEFSGFNDLDSFDALDITEEEVETVNELTPTQTKEHHANKTQTQDVNVEQGANPNKHTHANKHASASQAPEDPTLSKDMLGKRVMGYIDNEKQAEAVLKKLEKYASEQFVPILRTGTARLLKQIVRKVQPSSALEIGTAIGYSGTIILSNSPACELVTIELDPDAVKKASKAFAKARVDERVTILEEDCMVAVPELEKAGMGFDFIFLDGPKGQYIRLLPHLVALLNKGGILFADNVLFRGYVTGKEPTPKRFKTIVKRMQEFLAQAKQHPQLINVEIMEIEDGVLLANKV